MSTVIPFDEYSDALRAGCDSDGAWRCFCEEAGLVDAAVGVLLAAAKLALHDLTAPQQDQHYETVPILRNAIRAVDAYVKEGGA